MKDQHIENNVYLGLGSNMGDKAELLRRARIQLNARLGWVSAQSRIYQTAPWGGIEQESFYNQCVEVKTSLPLDSIHDIVRGIEKRLGKYKPGEKYGPRTIDIDILLVDKVVYKSKDLEIPHPRMHERNFVLIPLAEIADQVIHPTLEVDISTLAQACNDDNKVEPLSEDVD